MKFRCLISFALGAAVAAGVLSGVSGRGAELTELRGEAERLAAGAVRVCDDVISEVSERFSSQCGDAAEYFPTLATKSAAASDSTAVPEAVTTDPTDANEVTADTNEASADAEADPMGEAEFCGISEHACGCSAPDTEGES